MNDSENKSLEKNDESTDNKTKKVTVTFHDTSPKDTGLFSNLGGFEPYEYFEDVY